MTLLDASRIVDNALQYARSQKLSPMTVAVLDSRGCVIALKVEDRSSLLRPQIAAGKAWSALGLGFGTRNLAARAAQQPTFYNALAALSDGRTLPVPGGVLIRSAAGEVIGAVGASGDGPDNDEGCAVAGIEAIGLVPDVGAPLQVAN
jgi:uncharacterized protein GlcG (DUF336 family)